MKQSAVALVFGASIVVPSALQAATAGGEANHTVVVKTTDQTVWTWGDHADGELGDGVQRNRGLPPAGDLAV